MNDVLNPVMENRLHNNSCYSCGQTRHYAKQCPKNTWTNATFKPQIHYLEAGPSQHDVTGYVHHISADEAQENPEVVIGMFPINNIPAVILFDSGASHSFILGVLSPKTNFLVRFWARICWYKPRDLLFKAILSAAIWKLGSMKSVFRRL